MCPKISLDKREYPNGGGSLTEHTGRNRQTPPSKPRKGGRLRILCLCFHSSLMFVGVVRMYSTAFCKRSTFSEFLAALFTLSSLSR